jgi:hypothetical protein
VLRLTGKEFRDHAGMRVVVHRAPSLGEAVGDAGAV